MSAIHRLLGQAAAALLGALLVAGSFPATAAAQQRSHIYDESSGELVDPGDRDGSLFRLFGEGDRASTGLRATGNTAMFLTNTGIVDAADINGIDSQPNLVGCPLCPLNLWFDVSPIYAAPRSDWLRFTEAVPELLNARGGGWAVSRNFPSLGVREILASDRQFGIVYSGVQSATDGSCLDFSGGSPGGNFMTAGLTLLAASNCPPTWPVVGGEPTFLGENQVSAEAFAMSQAVLGPEFQFEWWRVDPELVDPSKFFGSLQTYGAYDDYNSSMIERFGEAVPGGSGEPEDEGWPLGLRTEFQGFVFALPTVSNTLYWRAIIINRTEEVYGVGLDYEDLYVGYSLQPIRNQESTFYAEVWRGAILTAESGTGSNACPGAFPPGTGTAYDCNNPGAADNAFMQGASGVVVLKSPIGDLRNVLLSCSPSENAQRSAERAIPCTTDAFFDPSNPHSGDTITYNHFRMCPFGTCSEETYASSVDRQMFGGIASNAADVLNGRNPTDIPGGPLTVYGTFRNPNFPQQPTPFAAWVPGTWDYSANGENPDGDTLFVSTCYGLPGQGREAREDACVVTWADTMPRGELNNPAYNNQEGNISHWSAGPFPLAAGDTAALVLALVTGIDSAGFEAEVSNAIDLYMNFFLSPEAPPPVNIVGAQINVIDPSRNPNGLRGQVNLFWDDASDDFVDPFLEAFADNLEAAVAGDLLRIRTLNPDLVDRIRTRARDNLDRIMIFKSCDAGQTFTTNDIDGRGDIDCDADPATGIGGSALGPGWQSYAEFPVDASGNAPNAFQDNLVKAGQTYLYAILGQTRGATFAIVDSLDVDGDGAFDALGPDSLPLAPPLINSLSRSVTDPNVVSVYVPATLAAGGEAAAVDLTQREGHSTVPFSVQLALDDPLPSTYRAEFGNEFEIARAELVEEDTTLVEWKLTVRDVVLADVDEPEPAEVAVDSSVYRTLNPNGITVAGFELTGDLTTATGLGFAVVRDDSEEPLLVTTLLDGVNTTDPEFFGRVAVSNGQGDFTGFPGFLVTADNGQAGGFNQALYFTESGVPVPAQIVPTVAWNNQSSSPAQGGEVPLGDYEIAWVDETFGPGSPFRLDLADPAATDAQFDASLEARAVGQVGRVDEEVAAAIADAVGAPVTVDQLVAVRVPFAVRNATFDREVGVAMMRRASDQILLGDIRSLRSGQTTRDTLSVTVAEDVWVPGDRLFFLETVELDSTVSVGGTPAIALDDEGRPIKVQRELVTFAPAVLDCGQAPRPTCNPVIGPGNSQDWVSNIPGQVLAPQYFAGFDPGVEFRFELRPAVTAEDVLAGGMDISGRLDSVLVVPNPYIVFSEYQVASASQNDARLMFTHLPPTGTLRIFTVAGRFVQEIAWEPDDLAGNGDLFWDMRTREGNNAGAGLYVFVVEADNPATGETLTKIGKFVIIR